ncbi:hypothetical protein BDK51DRAFT_44844 [Blyttiomyces helicus]|uniref:DNA ligase ATP-dependent N-terminal domain-containing protein n=1 Tax=Blyttiomyces helicus TaxID=388810 RepID=A0A4P9W534_9FUNG|nr:hypothetical protein BDK51DRAFT_44844 [Blyttiomyces helicus]|eukprot:RKO85850.1 hypothetical protein BDK51DRAFT_44844 [Blyttiomyces helicus]
MQAAALPPKSDAATRFRFRDLSRLFDRLTAQKGNARKATMEVFIDQWRATGGDFFPALRLILPSLDDMRTAYGMKDKVLAKMYVDLLGISTTSPDAQALLEWRNPGKTGKVRGRGMGGSWD